MPVQLRTFIFTCLLLLPVAGFGAANWDLCTAPLLSKKPDSSNHSSITDIYADQLKSENRRLLEFIGNVHLTRNTQVLSADQLLLDKNQNLISAQGNLQFADQLFNLKADSIQLDNDNSSGLFNGVDFRIYDNHMRGSASRINQLDTSRRELYEVSYTTCDPDSNAWSLDSSKLTLNQQTGQGTALNAVLRIKDIPVFYFPWFQFPVDDRRMSGFLAPTLTQSEIAGTQLTLPVYWNQIENADMTLTPIWYSHRGTQINTENRYLFAHNSGQLNLSYLDDNLTGDTRWFRRWSHQLDLPAGFQSRLLIQRVSDTDFLDDFDHLEWIDKDIDYLKSSLKLEGQPADWSLQLLFEEHQVINTSKTLAASPYKRLPQISLDRLFTLSDSALTLNWSNEWVKFDKMESITGDRLHINPVISYLFEDSYYFIKPALQLDYTDYSLDNNDDDLNSITRSLPLISIDSGLIFERRAGSDKSWTQTLEPRLYLLYVPFEDQSAIPDFDSALLAESFDHLFINNRFSGADRIGDSRQISLGLTSRLLDQQSNVLFSYSIGQAFYAEDRQVSLNSTIADNPKSSLINELTYKPAPEWDIKLTSVYDQFEKNSTQTDFSIRKRSQQQAFNVEYHLRNESLEQTTLSFVYPLNNQWTLAAKQQLSLLHNMPVQNLFGLFYESCCWGFKALYEESSDNEFKNVDRAVYFQMTFKGLSNAGKDINTLLENDILGYQSRF